MFKMVILPRKIHGLRHGEPWPCSYITIFGREIHGSKHGRVSDRVSTKISVQWTTRGETRPCSHVDVYICFVTLIKVYMIAKLYTMSKCAIHVGELGICCAYKYIYVNIVCCEIGSMIVWVI